MSAPVLVGLAGVLVAAAVTGVLAGWCFRRPGLCRVTWTVATLGLTVALAAQSMGFARGFDQVTFRAVQLTVLLVVPLWLAWGLVELAVGNDAVRFGTRLIAGALTVVAAVILATDPLSARPFSTAWPLASVHAGPFSRSALDAVQAVAVLAALASLGVVLAGRGLRPPLAAVLPSGLAVLMTAGLRFPLPDQAVYPLLSTAAAGLVWFGASKIGEAPRRADTRGQAGDRGGKRGGVRDDGGRYRPGDEFWPEDAYRPADGSPPGGQYATYGQRTGYPAPGRPGDQPGSRPGDQPGSRPGGGDRGGRPNSASQPQAQPQAPPGAGGPARPYGRIQIFTLLDDRVADFDRLAEEMTERVTGEPDTLVYVIHLVPNAPMQRIFYEIYRDRAAFDSHESQPYVQRFAAERRSLVLATNVIELGLKYAKVAPLPAPQSALPAGAAPPQPMPPQPMPPPPPRSQPGPAAPGRGPQRPQGPHGPQGPAGDPRLQPPPPGRSQPPPAGPPRYEPRRPDPRQAPSAGRPYGG
jgi:quinol monooxygenase YgiN